MGFGLPPPKGLVSLWAGDGQEVPDPDSRVRNRALAECYSAGFVLLSGACPAASVCL